jgi:hypothetical protein
MFYNNNNNNNNDNNVCCSGKSTQTYIQETAGLNTVRVTG